MAHSLVYLWGSRCTPALIPTCTDEELHIPTHDGGRETAKTDDRD